MHMLQEGTHDPMALLRLKRHAQITIPAELRKQFHLEEGDYLEVEATAAGILLKPISVVSREAAWDNVIEVMENVHAKQPHSDRTPEEQEADIVEIVKASRRKHAKRRS
jgi:AbrB family looped-hinge helix DNA binding protein